MMVKTICFTDRIEAIADENVFGFVQPLQKNRHMIELRQKWIGVLPEGILAVKGEGICLKRIKNGGNVWQFYFLGR